MDEAKIREHNQYNRRFYTDFGASFARQREYYWPSWYQFAQQSPAATQDDPVRVTDIGCGSARFALFWQTHVLAPVEFYTGMDISPVLLAVAEEQLASSEIAYELQEIDIVERLLQHDFQLPPNTHVATLFGVLHHIPGKETRQRLLQVLIQQLPPKGEIWLTIWNPGRVSGKKNRSALDLGNNDHLLGWQHEVDAQRFVHWISAEEEASLLKSLSSVKVVARWEVNTPGERGNICLLLQKQA